MKLSKLLEETTNSADFRMFIMKNMKTETRLKELKKLEKFFYMIMDPMTSHVKYSFSDREKAIEANKILRERGFKFMITKVPIDQGSAVVYCHPEFEIAAVLKPLAEKLIKRKNKL